MDYTTFYLNMNRISLEEIERTIVQYVPSFIFSINYYNGLSELCEKYGLRFLCWEIDPSLGKVPHVHGDSERSYVFNYRKKNVEAFEQAGLKKTTYLPLGANCKRRKPVDLTEEERRIFESEVSFVGSSVSFRSIQ